MRILSRRAAYTACACALLYAASKVHLAIEGEAGLPGFPATAEVSAAHSQIALRQLGNAALGLVAAVIALATVQPWGRRLPRALLIIALWGIGAALVAGVVALIVRLAGLAEGAGQVAAGLISALVLACGIVWAISWGVMVWGYLRSGRPGAG